MTRTVFLLNAEAVRIFAPPGQGEDESARLRFPAPMCGRDETFRPRPSLHRTDAFCQMPLPSDKAPGRRSVFRSSATRAPKPPVSGPRTFRKKCSSAAAQKPQTRYREPSPRSSPPAQKPGPPAARNKCVPPLQPCGGTDAKRSGTDKGSGTPRRPCAGTDAGSARKKTRAALSVIGGKARFPPRSLPEDDGQRGTLPAAWTRLSDRRFPYGKKMFRPAAAGKKKGLPTQAKGLLSKRKKGVFPGPGKRPGKSDAFPEGPAPAPPLPTPSGRFRPLRLFRSFSTDSGRSSRAGRARLFRARTTTGRGAAYGIRPCFRTSYRADRSWHKDRWRCRRAG